MNTQWNSFTTWLSTQDYFSLKTLFSTNPPAQWNFMWVYVAFVLVCLVGGIASLILPMHKEIRDRVANMLWTNVLIGAALFFFRYQQVPVFGTDAWRTIQLITFVIWVITIIRFVRSDYRDNRKVEKVAEYKNKYLPEGNRR